MKQTQSGRDDVNQTGETSRNYIQYAREESSTSIPERNTLGTRYLGFLPRKMKECKDAVRKKVS